MITLRRSAERRHVRRDRRDLWLTFPLPERTEPQAVVPLPEGTEPQAVGFGILSALSELRLPPGGTSAPLSRVEAEIVTYVYQGALAQEDTTGSSGVVHAGEFQHLITGRGVRHQETNASRTDGAHLLRIGLQLSEVGLDCAREQKRFAAAERHNELCVVASPDGRRGSLRLLQDALIYSSVLDPGHHLIHEQLPGRSAWLQVIHGEVNLRDTNLSAGDGAGVTLETAVSFTAQENTELLLVDLGPPPRSLASEVRP